ncbi:polyisoprenoid-binding protein [Auraticoccus sp. F435]|uniref:Polyisoprenoid-binding protein n=1 Tax=Auraticoccus cholistanensis TaxID=2656650 RepID=A0A6A9V288_9ACTN|nr:YceI family protein [Auraticoccus cholistanensis]MVA77679.1 polyisoprenoid-binding protein [Auraticoccus cholistanensis]
MTTTPDTTSLATGTWQIDPAHSEVAFTVRHLMSKVRGTFDEFSGTVTTQGEDPTAASVTATVQMASVNTRNAQRDGHLRSADLFDADTNATMTFTSTSITGSGDRYQIAGDLTIHGVTKSVVLDAEFLGVDVDAYGATRLGAEATTSISRKEFGIDFNVPLEGEKLLIGDKVDITLTIQAVRA